MSDPNDMPKADLVNDPKLKDQLAYAKFIEAKNFARAARAKKLLFRSRVMCGILSVTAASIYAYTMIRIKEETFLDDFEEPPRASNKMSELFKHYVKLPPMPTIRDLLRLYNLRALKQLSQNFLMDSRIINRIVYAAGNIQNGMVCEVGPGPGGISRAILNHSPKYLLLIEKDERFRPLLECLEDAAKTYCKVDVKYADIMGFNMEGLFEDGYKKEWSDTPPNIHIIGNLPFDISTPLIIDWLENISKRSNAWSYGRTKMTLTFQKEVGERMVAPVLSKNRCRLSVMCQNWCEVYHKFIIPGRAFLPKPDVDVSVVHFVPRISPLIPLPFTLIEKVLRVIFGTRQKYINHGVRTFQVFSSSSSRRPVQILISAIGKRLKELPLIPRVHILQKHSSSFYLCNIRNLFPVDQRDALSKEVFRISEIDPKLRSFQLSVEEYGRICQAYKEICDRDDRLYFYDYRGNRESREYSWYLQPTVK